MPGPSKPRLDPARTGIPAAHCPNLHLYFAGRSPELVKLAPHTTPVRRLDEAGAARNPDLRFKPSASERTQ